LFSKKEEVTPETFKQRIKDYEDHLFGVYLYFQGVLVMWSGHERLINRNQRGFEKIIRRGEEALAQAKHLLQRVQEDPNNFRLLSKFKFPPVPMEKRPS